MKKVVIAILGLVFLNLLCSNVKAYTKEDIIGISYNINTCSSKTAALVKGYRSSYIRLLNERDVSQKDLNKIYKDISSAISILNSNNLCSIDQKDDVSKNIKNKLYFLYDEASEILVNSPMLSTEKKIDTKMVIDNSNNEIKIYQNGALADVVKLEEKLNYVGINKYLIVTIVLSFIFFVSFFIIRLFVKKSFILNGLIYAFLFIIIGLLLFKNQISIVFDTISLMKVKEQNVTKDIVVNEKKIISYPLYGDKYAKISILNKNSDVFFGDSSDILKKGVGQSSIGVLPGESGTTILSGHNTGVLSTLFKTKKGDKIDIQTVYGRFVYEVKLSKIVNDTDISALDKKYDLILYTCYPNNELYGNKRLVVYGKLISDKWLGEKNEKNN